MKTVVTFEKMVEIYRHWFNYDKTGTQADLFKKHGWTRTKFFNECFDRGVNV